MTGLVLTGLILVIAGSACRQSDTARSGPQTRSGPEGAGPAQGQEHRLGEAPTDFSVLFGSGGGFTGRWNGYVIESDGSVRAWSGTGVRGDTTRVGRLAPAALDTLWRAVVEAAFFDDQTNVPGNMTAFLEVTAEGRSHRVTWVPTVEGLEPPATPTEAVYRLAGRLAQEAE